MKTSGKSMEYFDPETNEKYIPYVIEPSLGVERLFLAIVCEAYDEEEIGDGEKSDVRTVMHLHPALAPVKAAILPLTKKLKEPATDLYMKLAKKFNVEYDEAGQIGTPFCITFDFDSLEDNCVTVRDRDTMAQERVNMDELVAYLEKKLEY